MLQTVQKRKSEGFTIIEVLIVLAIAGLIMVVVFLAVPNLQRSQRNTARKQDASDILTAADNQISNANGSMPTDLSFYDLDSAHQLGALTTDPAATNIAGGKIGLLNLASGTNVNAGSVTLTQDAVLVVTNAECTNGTTNKADYKSRSIAVIYSQEKAGGYNMACINS